jgi:hypothetical protein
MKQVSTLIEASLKECLMELGLSIGQELGVKDWNKIAIIL